MKLSCLNARSNFIVEAGIGPSRDLPYICLGITSRFLARNLNLTTPRLTFISFIDNKPLSPQQWRQQ